MHQTPHSTLEPRLGRLAAMALSLAPMAASAADATADFSIAANPNGVWTYGSLSAVSDTSLTVFTVANSSPAAPGPSGSIDFWQATGGDGPSVGTAGSSGWKCCGTVDVGANTLTLHPGNGTENYAVIQYTAPVSGAFQFSGSFFGQNTVAGSTDVHVLQGGAAIWSANLIGPLAAAQSFMGTVNLNAGQSLSFAVGRGTNDYSWNSTGLTATVTAVPEPGTVALMLAGMGVVASVARRRGVAAR